MGNPGCSHENTSPEGVARVQGSKGMIDAEPERSSADTYLLEALTEALQIAFDATIFSNRFEIDEQGPVSRIEALTERLIEGIENFSKIHSSQDVAKATSISIIGMISKRLRASII